jgi:hypothetical protein
MLPVDQEALRRSWFWANAYYQRANSQYTDPQVWTEPPWQFTEMGLTIGEMLAAQRQQMYAIRELAKLAGARLDLNA